MHFWHSLIGNRHSPATRHVVILGLIQRSIQWITQGREQVTIAIRPCCRNHIEGNGTDGADGGAGFPFGVGIRQ